MQPRPRHSGGKLRAARDSNRITRRDFLHGSLLAAGGAALGGLSPASILAAPSGTDGAIGTDPRVLHGGNLRRTFEVGHWLRDGRLRWSRNWVRVERDRIDGFDGRYPIETDDTAFDLIVVGGGISGLSSAWHARAENPDLKILILENNPRVGGNASRDFDAPLPFPASAAGAYFAYPYTEFLEDFYAGIAIDWDEYVIEPPIYSYFFDSDFGPTTTRDLMPSGTKRWVHDTYSRAGIKDMPFDKDIRKQFKEARKELRLWYKREGAPTDPPDASGEAFDYLSRISFRDYLEGDLGFHPVVADYYDQYTSDSFAGLTSQVNAHSAISFLGAEQYDLVTAPGGLSFVARKALKALIPNAINGDTDEEVLLNRIRPNQLDRNANDVRYRVSSTALRVEQDETGVSVAYYNAETDSFHRSTGSALILAGQMFSAKKLVAGLAESEQLQAAASYQEMPAPIANVVVNNSEFLVDAEVGYNVYWYGNENRIWQDAVIADWATVGGTPAALDGSRPNVLTVYSGGFGEYADAAQERANLLTRPFSTYEEGLRDDLGRIFAGNGFDFDRDVDAIHLYRWGHSLVAAPPGWLFGAPDAQGARTAGARVQAREPIGRISFAGQDTVGNPAIENAIYSGLRAAQEVQQFF